MIYCDHFTSSTNTFLCHTAYISVANFEGQKKDENCHEYNQTNKSLPYNFTKRANNQNNTHVLHLTSRICLNLVT